MFKFSVIVPVYNASQTIERCVDSLVNNSNNDLQIILIEDCSKDNSWALCQELSQKYSFVTALHNQQNRGVSFTRNRGIAAAAGEYILFCDSDDYWDIEYLEIFRNAIKSGHHFAICGYINHDEKLNGRTDIICFEKADTISLRASLEEILAQNLLQQLWNKLFRADIIRKNNIRFDETISIGEDFRFILDYIRLGDIHSAALIDKPLYHYMRDQAGSLMYRVGYESIEEPLKNLASLYKLMELEPDEIDKRILQQRSAQIKNYAYLIMHNAGMPLKEKKRLILSLDKASGKDLYRQNRNLFFKERIAKLLRR